jgi:hypothetical protein
MTTPTGPAVSSPRTLPPEEVALRQRLVAAEHAAIYAYGVLGARLTAPLQAVALAAYDTHRARRDILASTLRAAEATVPAAKGAYDVRVQDQTAAVALAVQVEEGLAVRWRDLVGGTFDPEVRTEAVGGLTESAVRAATWRRAGGQPPTVTFPGT